MGLVFGIMVCFLLFFVYDLNDVLWKKVLLKKFFMFGGVLLIGISIFAVIQAIKTTTLSFMGFAAGISCFLFFLILLSYTLFFAIPFKATYTDDPSLRMACTTGMYALCRHPGVLWMAAMYAALWAAVPSTVLGQLFITTTICNILYVIFQDIWTFPKTFYNYKLYKKGTPFLLPTFESMKKCVRTFKKGEIG